MKQKIVLIIFFFLFIARASSEECSSPGEMEQISDLQPKYIGEVFNSAINGAISAYIDNTTEVLLSSYFSARLNDNGTRYILSTTQEFENYEKNQTLTTFLIDITFECELPLTPKPKKTFIISLARVNNYAPEFSKSSYEFNISTPLPAGFEITYFLDEEISVIDYDLYDNKINFILSGSDMFEIKATETSNEFGKIYYVVKIFTTQPIYQLENGVVEITLKATDTFNAAPQSTSIPIKILIDPTNTFIPSPAFTKPLYKGQLFTNGTLVVDEIRLIESTYDENVNFTVSDDFYGLIKLSNDGPQVKIEINQVNLSEEIFNQKFITFIIEAKRNNENDGYASVIIETISSSQISDFAFSKSLYEGELQEKSKILSIENIFIQGSMDDINFIYSKPDREFFNFTETSNEITITLNENASIELIMAKTSLIFTIDAYKNELKVASTTVLINNVAAVVPQFDKKYYIGSVVNGSLEPLTILITEETYSDEVEVRSENEYFGLIRNGKEINLKLRSDNLIPSDIKLITFVIEAKEDERKSETLVIIEIESEKILVESLQFESLLYQGTLFRNSSIFLPEIKLNFQENVTFELFGTHGSFFTHEFNGNEFKVDIKEEYNVEQFINDDYLHIFVSASHENLESAATNIILSIEKENKYEESLIFNSALYEGSLSLDMNFELPTITLNQYEGVNITLDGRHGNYFKSELSLNVLKIELKNEYTFEQLANELYLQITLNAMHPNMTSALANVILKIQKKDINYEGILVFNSELYQGSLSSDMNLELPTITLNENEGIQIELAGTHGSYFNWNFTESQLILELKEDIDFSNFINDVYLQITITASHETFKSATTNVIIEVVKKDPIEKLSFSSELYEGNLSSNGILTFNSIITINIYEGVNFALLGKHKDFFSLSENENQLNIALKSDVSLEQFNDDLYLHLKLDATHEKFLATSSNVIIGIERKVGIIDQVLKFDSEFYEGTITEDLILDISTFTLNYYGDVNISLSGTHGYLFSYIQVLKQVEIKMKYDVNFEQFSDDSYLHVIIEASRENYKSATANIIISIKREDEIQKPSKFEKNLYIGNIDNQKILNIEPIFIHSENFYTSISIIGLDSEYFTSTIYENFVSISLAKEITQDLLFQKTILIAQITAEYENSTLYTNLIVTLPRVTADKILRFENSYYIGSIDNNLELHIENIVLELANYDNNVNFILSGNDVNYFTYDRSENSIKLKLMDNINEEEIKEKVFLSLKVKAERNEFVSAETVILIHLNVIVSNITPIEFENPVYIGHLTYDQVWKIENPKLLTDDKMIEILHKGEHKDKFKIQKLSEAEGNLFEIEISFIQQPIDASEKFYYFYIEAVKFGAPKAYATIIIEIIDKVQFKFDEMKYFGRLDENQELIIDPIHISSNFLEGASFNVYDGQHQFFRVIQTTSNNLQILKISLIPNDILQNFRYLWFYLQASGNNFYSDRTLVIIETAQKLPEIPIEECYDTLDPTQPIFVTGSYSFIITNEFYGYIARIKAITLDKNVTLIYDLVMENSFLHEKLVILDGDLILHESIPTGIYKITVTAKNLVHNKEASASITLVVTEASLCEDGEKITTVNKALSLAEIEENTINNQIMYAKIGNCNYEILEVSPNALKDHITIDVSTNFIKNVKEFDRESEHFKDYLVPQVLITLRLNCGSSVQNTSSLLSISPYASNVYTDEILFSTSITYLNLHILDQNDNYPIFTNPSDTYNIGFPDEKLIEITMPKYLFKVNAYDLDEGINALIKYSTNMPSTFYINSDTGEIHPLKEMSNDPFVLVLTATDQNGAGLKSSTSLNVTKLTIDNIIEIVVETASDLSQFVNHLSSQTDVDLRILSSTQVPFESKTSFWLNIITSSYEAKNKIYVYAFQQSSLLIADELLEKLNTVELNMPIKYGFVDSCTESTHIPKSCDLKSWIFTVSFMGTILLLIIIALPLIYIFWLKPKLSDDLKSNSSKEELVENNYSEPGTSIPVVNETNENSERRTDADILEIQIEGVTEDSTTTDAEKLNNRLLSYLEDNDDIPTNEKKNVSFKEIVERIEVFEDQDDKN